MERFIIQETPKSWLVSAYLESNPEIKLSNSDEPLFRGARKLLELGFPPETLLNTRWKGKDFDNFVPQSIEMLSKITVTERDIGGLSFEKYRKDPRFKD